jgi:hypothetical protein
MMRGRFLFLCLLLSAERVVATTPCNVIGVNQPSTTHLDIVFECQFKRTALPTIGAFTVTGLGDLPQPASAVIAFGGDAPDNFNHLLLQTSRSLLPGVAYQLTLAHLADDTFAIDNKTVDVKGTGDLTFPDRITRRRVFASFAVPITDTAPTVSVTRFDKTIPVGVTRATRNAAGTATDLILAEPLRTGDKIKVTATSPAGTPVDLSDKVAFPKPNDRKDAQLSVAVSSDAGRRQKPNVNLDLATNFRRPLHDGWTQAPSIDATVATQDQNGTNKASLKDTFEYFTFAQRGAMPIAFDIAPTIELDKKLQNRNGILDIASVALISGGPHLDIRPGLGIEAGKNFGLQRQYGDLKDFTILRPKATIYAIYAWDFQTLGIQRVAFTLDATGRWLTHDEPYSIPIPPSRQQARGLGKRPPSTARVSHSYHSLCYWKKRSRSPMKNQAPTTNPTLISPGTKTGVTSPGARGTTKTTSTRMSS